MVTLHGKEVKVGDTVWSIQEGYEKVTAIDSPNCISSLIIKTKNHWFTEEGKYFVNAKYPSLFWKEQVLDLSKPLPKLEVDDKVIVWDDEGTKYNRHFSHFQGNYICCFASGATFYSGCRSTTAWQNYEVFKDTK